MRYTTHHNLIFELFSPPLCLECNKRCYEKVIGEWYLNMYIKTKSENNEWEIKNLNCFRMISVGDLIDYLSWPHLDGRERTLAWLLGPWNLISELIKFLPDNVVNFGIENFIIPKFIHSKMLLVVGQWKQEFNLFNFK